MMQAARIIVVIGGLAVVWCVGGYAFCAPKPLSTNPHYTGTVKVTYPMVPGASCSGVVISDVLALTAGHCAISPVATVQQGLRVANGKFVYIDGLRDLAVIQGDFTDMGKAAINFSQAYFEVGKKYRSCGHPFGQEAIYCVNLGAFTTNDGHVFNFKQAIMYGMSGGPVYDVATAQVTGLNTYLYPASMGGGSGFTPTLGITPILQRLDPTGEY